MILAPGCPHKSANMPAADQQQELKRAALAVTPGQKLLASLTDTTAGRLQRHSKTTAACQSRVKQNIPAPKAPSSSDVGATSSPAQEVHQLPTDAPKTKGNMQGILAMLEGKAQRHAAAWDQYSRSKQEAEQRHCHAAATAAASSKTGLADIDRGIEQRMAVLAEDKVMVLDEQQQQQVWESVEQQRGYVTACIDALAAGLQSAEQGLRQEVQAALQDMVAAMYDIAHLDEGRIQRLTEQESAALNLQLLENRRAASEVLQQLEASAVLEEQARFKRWQAACEAWRTLRSHHAVASFCQHVKQDLAEPLERLQLFAQLQEQQQAAHGQLLKLCQRLRELGPPHLNAQSVGSWVSDGKHWVEGWQQQLDSHLQGLHQQEQRVEQQMLAELAALRCEVLSYKGLSDSQVDELLAQEAQPVLEQRRAAAHALLQCAEAFVQRQAAEWQLAVQVLSSWLSSLVGLFESHKAATSSAESSVKAALRAAVDQFEAGDAAREAALAAAVQLLGQGSDEKELDARLEAALLALSDIQAGYRTHTAAAVSTVRAYPGQVQDSNDRYQQLLCGLLHVRQQLQAAEGSSPAGEDAAACAAGTAAPAAVSPADPVPDSQHPQGQGQLPTGACCWQLQESLWQGLLDATPKPWLAQFSHIQPAGSDSAQQPSETAETAAEPAAAAHAAAAAVSSSGGKVPAAAKPTKQQLAEAAAAEEAARAAEAAAAAAAEEAAAYAAAVAPPPCPTSTSNSALCAELSTPGAVIIAGLQELQACMLLEAESFAGRVHGCAETWAEQMEALLTEELDARLRAHRPRAGRIEEEVRVGRSTELVAQRRRVDSHLKAQERAVQRQQEEVAGAVLALRADAAAWRARLLDYERLLGSALSSKGIDICWREAQALRVKLDRQLQQRAQLLQQLGEETCGALTSGSTAFEAEHLKSFADGGRYAEASLLAHRANLAALHSYVSQQQAQQQAELAALHTELVSSLQEAQDKIEALLPSHQQDMALVELLADKVEGARKKAAAELSRNSQAADSIDVLLVELRGCLSRGPTAAAAAAATAGGAGPKGDCQQLVGCVDKLRQQLLRQSQVLEMLQSTSIPNQPIAVTLPGDLQPLASGQDSQAGAAAGARAASTLPTSQAATPQAGAKAGALKFAAKGGRVGSAAGAKGAHGTAAASNTAAPAAAAALAAAGGIGGPAAADAAAVPLAKHITSIIDASKQEVEGVAKAYFAAKEAGRPIRCPSNIAPSLQELMQNVDGVMSGLRQMLQEHMGAAVKHLRVQVVQAYRLLEQVPAAAMSLLMQHMLQLSAAQRQQLLGDFTAQRQQLERQLEKHKHSLHPSMLSVARRPELEALKAAEAGRQQAAAALTAACATSCLSLTHSHAQQLAAAAADLSRLLLALLDGCVLPADLLAAPQGDDALAGLQRLSLEELSRLAAAQEAAQPAGAAGGQLDKSGAAGRATKPGDGTPFAHVSWQLQGDGLSLASLGWASADQAALVAAGQATSPLPAAAAAAVNAAPVVTGQPKAAPATQGSTAPKAIAGTAQVPATAAEAAEPLLVSGMDTICQRAVVLAHRAAMLQLQAHLTQGSVGALKQELYGWRTQEQQWSQAWEAMLQELDTV